jgi:hypothetical protein
MIPQRLELQTHPYQEYALPIKLRNHIIYIKSQYIGHT